MIFKHFEMGFPIIDFDNIVLRELTVEDAPEYLNYMSKTQMIDYVTKTNIPSTLNEAIDEMRYWGNLFHNKQSFYWGIALKESNRLVGSIGFNTINQYHMRAEISYDLNPNFWGQGIMLKSLNRILYFADNILNLVRIQATVIIDNIPSIRLLERSGFANEGLLKKYEIVNGQHRDYYMYARLS